MGMLDAATGGYAVALVQSIVALAGVCALVVVILRMLAARGLGRVPRSRTMQVVERLAVDPRSSVCIVAVGERRLLVGISDGAAPRLLAELETASALESSTGDAEAPPPSRFRALLARRDPAGTDRGA